MNDANATRAGFVALIGAPNAGKSTLLNRFVGFKLSIVTHKVQTTRTRIRGVCMAGPTQIVFVDTPGIFEPRRRLDRAMVDAAWQGAGDADVVALLYDVGKRKIDADTQRIIAGLKETGRKAILVLNKVDLIRPEELLPLAAAFDAEEIFEETFMISAEGGAGCDDFLAYLADRMPEGPWLYPEDEASDLPERLLAAEVTREQVLLRLHQELPYAATVETEQWTEREDGEVVINQVLYVTRPGHKKIALGKGGAMIKAIGSASRAELRKLLGRPVHLFLFVKVRENWMDDPDRYAVWGLDPNA
ncbi:MAG: GTPase Era [Alphaproteobacteria bacterium]|jgi:GTP-binding protein Era|nr:GTPase Era [Alphaproteobacteria bacterium]